jgi:hypothetical protein
MQIKRSKLQSAMEYLMTYGWSILIIAIVMVALFTLGVFGNTGGLGTSCIAAPGYLCQNPVLAHGTGVLTFTFGQNTGSTHYTPIIVVTNQANTLNANGFPSGNSIGTPVTGAQDTSLVIASNVFPSGSTASVSVTLDSTQLPSNTAGSRFTGYIWEAYNTGSLNGPINYAKVATILVKVT